MTVNPKVSIIMATYNRSHFIRETLLSIQCQTFLDWECIIIDDGGTDNTLEVISPILEEDKRFRFIRRADSYLKGLPGCRNCGIDLAKGEYVIFFDDDDIAHPQNLELCVLELSRHDVAFCRYIREVFTGDFVYNFDYSKDYNFFRIGINDLEAMLKNELPFNSCAVMWKRECFAANRFTEHLMYAEEWELYSRIIALGYNGISIGKSLFYGRKHSNSNTGEYYNDNPIRKKSYADAIVLVVENLNEKDLLSYGIIRYFITMAIGFKEYDLFNILLKNLGLSKIGQLKWKLFYAILPIRLALYKINKSIKLNR